MDECGVPVIREDDRPIGREHRIELRFRQPVRMLGRRLQRHQVDDVHDAQRDVRECLPQQVHSGQRFDRGDVAGTRHNRVRLDAFIATRPIPDPDAIGAMTDRRRHVQPLRRRMLAGDDHVHVVARAQAMIGDREQRVGVGRQIHAHDVRLLVDDVIDESRVLMAEPIVVLPPHVRGQEIVQ